MSATDPATTANTKLQRATAKTEKGIRIEFLSNQLPVIRIQISADTPCRSECTSKADQKYKHPFIQNCFVSCLFRKNLHYQHVEKCIKFFHSWGEPGQVGEIAVNDG
ncbi:MAG TPA: hypothetical protein VG672_16110 [Bryobacteraceae bacterium]|jgi:hypothetical protein|nr:hypothetical protein [Bryobacteraceae bacterium]